MIQQSDISIFRLPMYVHSQIADYYYDERMCLLRCVLLLLTYFQDERHPYRVRSCWIWVTSDN